ncbi:MAG: hypothetical protein JXJ17_09680 [Anaerolineae bacterium]|nr:hypothetical protein [Anaerolineae bacterium]
MSDESNEQPKQIVEGEVLAEYSDTMLNLPEVDDATLELHGRDGSPPDPKRRQFITRLVLGSAAALAVGGSAALIYDRKRRDEEPQVVILPNEEGGEPSAELLEQLGVLDYDLIAMTAERDQLISDLDQKQKELDAAQADLNAAQATLSEYAGLIDLWQQLDDIGIDSLIAAGLASVSLTLSNVMSLISLLSAGLESGREVIDNFLASLPGPSDGIKWLKTQVTALAESIDWVVEQVQKAVDPVQPVARQIANFVVWVLDRLPFGIGAKAKDGLEAMQDLISDLPDLVEGVNDSVLDPLADWFGDDEKVSLVGILINPVEKKVVEPSDEVVTGVSDFEDTYLDKLVTPIDNALEQRAALRAQIEEAQARLGLHA